MSALNRLFAAGLLLGCGAARADWFSGNAGVVSDYVFRGLDQTNGPALQGGLDYVHHSGLYGGAWLTNNRSAGSGEADLYGGYTRQLPLFGVLSATLDAGVAGYVYTGERQAALGGPKQDFAEVYGGLGVGPASFKASFAPDYAGRGAPGWYLQGTLKYPLPAGFKLRAVLGYGGGAGVQRQTAPLTVDGVGHSYLDYGLRLSRPLPYDLTAWIEVAGTDLRLADHAQGGANQPKFLLGLRKDFDF
ncbi:MAG: hypothetical protein JWR07_5487 [Nevskia sp.]|nr:hypothetical protein [Nevskia sp.]